MCHCEVMNVGKTIFFFLAECLFIEAQLIYFVKNPMNLNFLKGWQLMVLTNTNRGVDSKNDQVSH